MARPPFDPDKVPSPAHPPAPPEGRRLAPPLSVSAVANLIHNVLEAALPGPIRVQGEVSNFSSRTHWFFSLKDDTACLRCVCFASAARRVEVKLQDGMEVICSGRLDYYDAQGHLQLYVERIEPVGQGALEQRFRALCAELRELGYFAPERKKPLPAVPRRVAVVTSRSGAALQDVIHTTRKRWPGCELVLVDVRVQGAAAAPEVASAITALSRHGAALGIDAIILTRGGGSIEDLWAFNERVVAEALYACRLPVVAAIGHETDTTIAELVADVRAATPTQAAMTLIPDATALAEELSHQRRRLALLVQRQVQGARQHLESLARHPLFRQPRRLLDVQCQRLDVAVKALHTSVAHRTRRERERLDALARALPQTAVRHTRARRDALEALARQLQAVSPLNVLQRGSSYTLGPDGRVLKRAVDARPGDRLTTVLAEGKVTSQVQDQSSAGLPPAPAAPIARPRRQRPAPATDPTQMDLF